MLLEDPFQEAPMVTDEVVGRRVERTAPRDAAPLPAAPVHPVVVCLTAFDVDESVLVCGVPFLAGEVVPARSAVALDTAMIGREAVVLFENGDLRRPIVIGVLERCAVREVATTEALRRIDFDDGRCVVEARREIILRCGDASITLTRAGKVLIEGNYVVSYSRGHNKIKGAAIDLN